MIGGASIVLRNRSTETWEFTSTLTRALAAAIFAILAVIVLATFRDYGISWDERLQNTYGEKLLDFYTSGFENQAAFSYINLYLYGGFFDLLAAIANLVSPFGTFQTRHLLGGLIFLVGLAGGWRLTRYLAGERAALIALACLATTPLLYGHGFINPKDSPFAWLGLWTTYFACRILGTAESEEGGKPSWGMIAGFGVSLGLTIGTRVIGIVYLFTFAAVFAAAAIARAANGERLTASLQRLKGSARYIVAALTIAFAVMALVWPWSVQKPGNVFAAFMTFEHFAFYPQVLWNGELIRADRMPESYLLGLLALQLPEYVLVGLVAAVIAGFVACKRRLMGLMTESRTQQYLFVICSALAPIAGYMVLRPTIYNGLRHFLFVVPPLVVLGAIGLDTLLSLATRQRRAFGAVLGALLIFGLARQVAVMAGLHPYQYLAYNALIGGIKGAENRFELDYWGTTLAESARGLAAYLAREPANGPATGSTIKVFACSDRMTTEPFLPAGASVTEVLAEADFYLGMTGVVCQGHDDRPGRLIFEVRRLGEQLGYVYDLRKSPSP